MATDFELHPQLLADTFRVGDWQLCRVLLMNDANYPWLILVPRRREVREIYELSADDRSQLLAESCVVGEVVMRLFGGHKLNVAALGNVVPQLHLHHIVRQRTDAAWPAPVWGKVPRLPYGDSAVAGRLALLRAELDRPAAASAGDFALR